MKPLSEFELGYIVGLFEGEGSIIFTASKRKNNPRKFEAYIHLTITNTNIKLLENTKKILGFGNIRLHFKGDEKWKRSYTYSITSKEKIRLFLEKVSPFLIEKSDKCKAALKWLEMRKESNYRRYTEEEIKIFKEIRTQSERHGGCYAVCQ
jgi:hypothetical protein